MSKGLVVKGSSSFFNTPMSRNTDGNSACTHGTTVCMTSRAGWSVPSAGKIGFNGGALAQSPPTLGRFAAGATSARSALRAAGGGALGAAGRGAVAGFWCLTATWTGIE